MGGTPFSFKSMQKRQSPQLYQANHKDELIPLTVHAVGIAPLVEPLWAQHSILAQASFAFAGRTSKGHSGSSEVTQVHTVPT